eukprot:SAG22_NODE_4271_length_1322_cov_1.464432_1_plen_224_part_10
MRSLRLDSHLLWMYKQDYEDKNSGELFIRSGSRFAPIKVPENFFPDKEKVWQAACKESPGGTGSLKHIFGILDFDKFCPEKPVKKKLDEILLDLTMYKGHPELVSNAFGLLTTQYKQRCSVADSLRRVSCKALSFCCASTVFLSKTVPFLAVPQQQVQLLCSKPQVAFFEKGEYLKNQLTVFLESDVTEKAIFNLNRTLDNMILSVTPGAVDGSTTLDQKIVSD